jgi:long-chain acyl-CoA synthetase
MSVAPSLPATASERATHAPTIGWQILAAAERYPGEVALRAPADGRWVDTTYAELATAAGEIARGLIAEGIRPGDRVAILGSTRPTWTLVDCAAMLAGATVVPLYQTNSPEECEYVLEHSGSRVVVCEDAEQLAKVQAVRDGLPDLEHVVAFDPVAGARSLGDLRERGATVAPGAIEDAQRQVEPGDVATIIYTSGTTGPPKGCMTTHANVRAAVSAYARRLGLDTGDPVRIFFFLPLAHSLTRVGQFIGLEVGATLAYWSADPARVLDELAEARPTHVPTVPRVLEKIHTRALARVEDGPEIKRALFRRALATGGAVRRLERAGETPGALMRIRHALGDRLVLSKVRGLFGPDLRFALTGAAPVAPEILEFFDACGLLVLEGYGMTESTAAATVNVEQEFRFGTVGRPLPGFEVRIADDGEILLRGPHIFAGYHRDPEATRQTLDADGWLHSGDLGALDPDGYLRITGRKKDLIITSSGKNVSPSNLENALRETRWISQAVVYGDNKPYLVALLTLDPEEAPALAERLGIEPDIPAMAANPEVRRLVQETVDEVNQRFARIEQVKRFEILETDLTQAAGHLTPTMKVKRPAVHREFAERFEALYAAPRS